MKIFWKAASVLLIFGLALSALTMLVMRSHAVSEVDAAKAKVNVVIEPANPTQLK